MTLALLAVTMVTVAQTNGEDYRLVELKTDSLPSLNIARSGHTTLCLDGVLTVFGGHSAGFVPTPTAEYFRDGAWHTVPLAYPHDHATAVKLRSGEVFLAGGHKEELGIGQLFSAEMYDPTTHTTQGFGSMNRKRAYANAIEMVDGQVVIAGNWFADDGIEMFSNVHEPACTNAVGLKDVSFARATPYILRISDDDAIIFSSLDNKAEAVDCGVVDRLKGSSYREPFLDEWHPLRTINNRRSENHFIGNEAEHRYEWLLPVENVEKGRVAIVRVKGPADNSSNATFSLLPTKQPLPDSINGKCIIYSSLVCDRERGLAYLIGNDDEARIFVVAIHYDSSKPLPLTIYVTAPQPLIAQNSTPVLTPEGDLVFAGGHFHSNFSPTNTVIRLPLGKTYALAANHKASTEDTGNRFWWLWIAIPCLTFCGIAMIYLVRRKNQKPQKTHADTNVDELCQETAADLVAAELFKRIVQLMEEEHLYLNANLRASDVAARVGSNTAYVSAAINSQRGCSFTQFLTAYRIAYAQELMRKDEDVKISTVGTLSGFSTDSTFFRALHAVTNMSPKD